MGWPGLLFGYVLVIMSAYMLPEEGLGTTAGSCRAAAHTLSPSCSRIFLWPYVSRTLLSLL